MNKEEQKRLKDAEEEGVKARVAQTKAQKERDEIRRERDALKVEKDNLNLSLRDNMNHVDDLNKQLQDYAKDYTEVAIDLEKTRLEKEMAYAVLQEIVDKFGGNKISGRLKSDEVVLETVRKAQQVLVGEKPDSTRPTPTERKRALQEKRKARMSR